jgi:hypothetical protein
MGQDAFKTECPLLASELAGSGHSFDKPTSYFRLMVAFSGSLSEEPPTMMV